MEIMLGKGYKSAKSSYIKYFINNINSPLKYRRDKNKIYSRLLIIDKDFKIKHIVGKYLYPRYYIIMYI